MFWFKLDGKTKTSTKTLRSFYYNIFPFYETPINIKMHIAKARQSRDNNSCNSKFIKIIWTIKCTYNSCLASVGSEF